MGYLAGSIVLTISWHSLGQWLNHSFSFAVPPGDRHGRLEHDRLARAAPLTSVATGRTLFACALH